MSTNTLDELEAACTQAADAAWNELRHRMLAAGVSAADFLAIFRRAWWEGGVHASERAEPPYTQLLAAAEKLVALMDEVPNDMPGGEADRVFPHYEFDELREALEVAKDKSPANVIERPARDACKLLADWSCSTSMAEWASMPPKLAEAVAAARQVAYPQRLQPSIQQTDNP